MTQIFIVDDHEIVRTGVKALVTEMSGWEVCGEAANGKDAIAQVLKLKPDVVLMDVSMPGMSGIEAARVIRNHDRDVKIVLLSMHDRAHVAAAADAAGAEVDAYLSKDTLSSDVKRVLSSMYPRPELKLEQMSDQSENRTSGDLVPHIDGKCVNQGVDDRSTAVE